jgi:transposase
MESESKVRNPTGTRYSDGVREREVRMVFEHQHEYEMHGPEIRSIASNKGMSRETLRNWIIQSERDLGQDRGRRLPSWRACRNWNARIAHSQ